jgi:hypothetical protein
MEAHVVYSMLTLQIGIAMHFQGSQAHSLQEQSSAALVHI